MEKKLFRSILWIITYAVLLVLFILRYDEVRNWVSTLLGVLATTAAPFKRRGGKGWRGPWPSVPRTWFWPCSSSPSSRCSSPS